VVAFLAGWISERGSRSFVRNLIGGAIAELVLFAAGISWLAVVTGSWQRAVAFGLAPFIFAEVMKVMVAAAVARRIQSMF
jgi:biotin transporter BioY